MCLHYIDKVTGPTEGVGWKMLYFHRTTGELTLPLKGSSKSLPLNVWLNEEDYREYPKYTLRAEMGEGTYTIGFHVSLSRQGARTFQRRCMGSPAVLYCARAGISRTLYRVQFRDVVASGTQYKCRTVVARQIMILRRSR